MSAGTKISKNLNPSAEDSRADLSPAIYSGLSLDEYRILMSVGPGVHYVCEAKGNFAALFIAPSVKAQFGYEPEDFTRNPEFWASNIHPEDRSQVFQELENLFARDFHRHEYRFRHQDGGYRWVFDELKLLRDPSGEPVKIVGQWVDVTNRKLAEAELTESAARQRGNETRLRTILDNAPIAIYLKDTEGRFVFSNRQNAEWYGVDATEAIGRTTEDYFPPDYAKTAVARDRKVIETGQTLIQETDISTRAGGTQHCLIYRIPMLDPEGNILGVLGMNLDITERKRAEVVLRETENRVRDFAEATSDWFWETDTEHRVTHRSSSTGGWHETVFDGRIGNSRFDFETFDGEPQKWRQHREDLAARLPFRDFRYKRPAPGGGVLYSSISGRPFFDLDGSFLGYRGTGMDVTAEVQARSQLVDAIDSMADGVVIFDAEDRLVTFNERYRETYAGVADLLIPGTRFEDLARAAAGQGLFAEAIGHEEDWIRERLENFHLGQNLVEQQMSDGSWLQITERKTPNGYTVGIRTDITELKQREVQFRQSQKMEAVGQLTGGVAHDFNNMLAAIIGNLELVQDGGVDEEFDKESIAVALRAAHRGAELTHRLLAFSRQQELHAKATEINRMLPQFSQLAQRTIGEDIAIEMRLAADLWPTLVDAGQLENALLNLAINARDAMPGGGLLAIETSNQILEEGDAATSEDLVPGAYVMISVSDSGTGMPADVREHAFEPFFTTKDVGEGSGLGLSMVFGFAKQSGGQVSIYSEQGQGTTVRIYLPKADSASTDDVAVEPSSQDRLTGNETVLVVEDDKAVRDYLVTVLGRLGYTVLQAEDGPAALEVMATPDTIDLLLTDVVLPRGMSGRDVAIAFRERYPAAGVLYSSGYTRDILNRRNQLDADVVLMNKPYQAQDLAQRVRQVLDGKP